MKSSFLCRQHYKKQIVYRSHSAWCVRDGRSRIVGKGGRWGLGLREILDEIIIVGVLDAGGGLKHGGMGSPYKYIHLWVLHSIFKSIRGRLLPFPFPNPPPPSKAGSMGTVGHQKKKRNNRQIWLPQCLVCLCHSIFKPIRGPLPSSLPGRVHCHGHGPQTFSRPPFPGVGHSVF